MDSSNLILKQKINEIVESMLSFANCILGNDTTGNKYSESEMELAQHIKIAIIFYKAREDKNEH